MSRRVPISVLKWPWCTWRQTKRKSTIFGLALFIPTIILGLFSPALSDTIEDVSGDWAGPWFSITNNTGGTIILSFTQNGAMVSGTVILTNTRCSSIAWGPVSGTVSENVLSFSINGAGCTNTITMEYSNGEIVNNTILGNFVTYVNNIFYGEGTFNVTRSVNTIEATADVGGAIAPAEAVSVNAGADQTFTIMPDDGYRILDVIVDGVSIGPKSSYTFRAVSANHTIAVLFEAALTAELPFGVLLFLLEDE